MPAWLKTFALNFAFQLVEAALEFGLAEVNKSLEATDKLDPSQKSLVEGLLQDFVANFRSALGK